MTDWPADTNASEGFVCGRIGGRLLCPRTTSPLRVENGRKSVVCLWMCSQVRCTRVCVNVRAIVSVLDVEIRVWIAHIKNSLILKKGNWLFGQCNTDTNRLFLWQINEMTNLVQNMIFYINLNFNQISNLIEF